MKNFVHFRLNDSIKTEFKKVCLKTNKTMSQVITECIIKFVKKNKNKLKCDEKSTNSTREL